MCFPGVNIYLGSFLPILRSFWVKMIMLTCNVPDLGKSELYVSVLAELCLELVEIRWLWSSVQIGVYLI